MALTIDPKSGELRRTSQQIVAALFDLNTSTFSIMSRSLPPNLQESSNRIIRGHIHETSSGDDSPPPSPLPSVTRRNKVPPPPPPPPPPPLIHHSSSLLPQTLPAHGTSKRHGPSHRDFSTPAAPSLSRQISASSPDISQLVLSPTATLPPVSLPPVSTPTTPRSRIPMPTSGSSGRRGRSRIPLPRSASKQLYPPRYWELLLVR